LRSRRILIGNSFAVGILEKVYEHVDISMNPQRTPLVKTSGRPALFFQLQLQPDGEYDFRPSSRLRAIKAVDIGRVETHLSSSRDLLRVPAI